MPVFHGVEGEQRHIRLLGGPQMCSITLVNVPHLTAQVRPFVLARDELETDVRRLQTWLRDVGVPRTKSYEETLKFSKYLKAVFTSKFNS